MTLEQAREKILEVGIIAVVRTASLAQAMLAVETVSAGGIPVVEVTMTVPGAIEVIAELPKPQLQDTGRSRNCPEPNYSPTLSVFDRYAVFNERDIREAVGKMERHHVEKQATHIEEFPQYIPTQSSSTN